MGFVLASSLGQGVLDEVSLEGKMNGTVWDMVTQQGKEGLQKSEEMLL